MDLRNFQKESHDKLLVPIMVSTKALRYQNVLNVRDRIVEPIRCNAQNLGISIEHIAKQYQEPAFDYVAWENSEYLPTPTIVEVAQALYRGHNVHDITRSDAGAENLTVTTEEINRIIEHSKLNGRKSICFVTGVPGAGKTLVGLNIAIQRSDAQQGENAVFLSGNFPLVTVLQEALARDKVEQERQRGNRVSKADALRSTSAFIQIIHKYRDSFVGNNNVPPERVAIFDEAQRAWTQDMIEKIMATKKGVSPFPYSEPEFLISTMDRHQWVRDHCKGTTRYGLLASSGALRLKPEGVFVKNEISVANWFLNGKDDVRSSYMLEDVVTEFDIQGLELDYAVVAWDADYRYVDGEWTFNNFVGNRWTNVGSGERRLYLKNAYRVLLTRARQGMAIFIPTGNDDDQTRKCEWYDGIYGYLKEIELYEV